jgi:hypothetical protein
MERVERFTHKNIPYTLLELSIASRTTVTIAIEDHDLETVLNDTFLNKLDDSTLYNELTEEKTGFSKLLHRVFGYRTKPYAFLHDRADGTAAYRENQIIALTRNDGSIVEQTAPRTEQHYLMGYAHGEQKGWHSTGWLAYTATYANGLCHGDACDYYNDGKKKTIWHFENGKPKAKADETERFPPFCYMGFDQEDTLIQAAFEANSRKILHGKKLQDTIAKFQAEKGVVFTLRMPDAETSNIRQILPNRLTA